MITTLTLSKKLETKTEQLSIDYATGFQILNVELQAGLVEAH